MHTVLRDIRHAARSLVRSPLFALSIIVPLGLGLGVNTALFGVFRGILWRPLAVENPDEMVTVVTKRAMQGGYLGFSYPEYEDYAGEPAFAGLASYAPINAALTEQGRPSSLVFGEAVSDNYFEVMRPRFQLGRAFRAAGRSGGAGEPVVVLSDGFWRTQFSSDPSIVGRTVTIDGRPLAVVGVTAPGFHGALAYYSPQFWFPVRLMPQMGGANERWLIGREATLRYQHLIGRLRPGTTLEQANTQVAVVAERLGRLYPATNADYRSRVFRELDTRPDVNGAATVARVAAIFLAIASLVLLVVCGNVANLMLARSEARRREVAARVALGATRAQVVSHLLTESVLLALTAGALGWLLALLTTRLIGAIRLPTDVGVAFDLRPDSRVALYAAGTALACGLVFGLLPALRAIRADVIGALKGESLGARTRRFSVSSALVVAQLAVSLVLLVIAGLFTRNLAGASLANLGFSTDNRAVFVMDAALVGYDAERASVLFGAVIERVRQVPGVLDASLVRWMPLDMRGAGVSVALERGGTEQGGNAIGVGASSVGDGYFRAAGTALLRGRTFSGTDRRGSARVAIVNEVLAARFWPGQEAIGKRVWIGADPDPSEVVGVAAGGRYGSLGEAPRPYLFLPLAQHPEPSAAVILHARGDLGRTLERARQAALQADPALPIFDARPLRTMVEGRVLLLPRLAAGFMAPLALLALTTSVTGLYAVVAYGVARRSRELCIRMAVGAAPADIVRLIVGGNAWVILAGSALGLALASGAARLVGGMLFAVGPFDPAVFVSAPLVLAAVAGLASYAPARRALRVNAVTALRRE